MPSKPFSVVAITSAFALLYILSDNQVTATTPQLGPFVTLTIEDSNGAPVPNALVQIYRDPGSLLPAYVPPQEMVFDGSADATGKLTVDLSSERPLAAMHFPYLGTDEYSYVIDYDILIDKPTNAVLLTPPDGTTHQQIHFGHYYSDATKIAAAQQISDQSELLLAAEHEELTYEHQYTVQFDPAETSTALFVPSSNRTRLAEVLFGGLIGRAHAQTAQKPCRAHYTYSNPVHVPLDVRRVHSSGDNMMVSRYKSFYGSEFRVTGLESTGANFGVSWKSTRMSLGYAVKDTGSASGSQNVSIDYLDEGLMSYTAQINVPYKKTTVSPYAVVSNARCGFPYVTFAPARSSVTGITDGVVGGQRTQETPSVRYDANSVVGGHLGHWHSFAKADYELRWDAAGVFGQTIEISPLLIPPSYFESQNLDNNLYSLTYKAANPFSGRTFLLHDSANYNQFGEGKEYFATYTDAQPQTTCTRSYGVFYGNGPGQQNLTIVHLSSAYPASIPFVQTYSDQSYQLTQNISECGGCDRVLLKTDSQSAFFEPRLMPNTGIPDPSAAPYNVTMPSSLNMEERHTFHMGDTLQVLNTGSFRDYDPVEYMNPEMFNGDSNQGLGSIPWISHEATETYTPPPSLRGRTTFRRVLWIDREEVQAVRDPNSRLLGHTMHNHAAFLFGTQPTTMNTTRYINYYIDDDDEPVTTCVFQ